MPTYDYRCESGHRFERLVPIADGGQQPCPCGAAGVKVPSNVALGGRADTGRPREYMPQTWRGTHDADREYTTALRREWSTRQKLEDKHPELQGDRCPIVAHEGRYERAPLRQGDPIPGASAAAPATSHGHTHGSGHSHHDPASGSR